MLNKAIAWSPWRKAYALSENSLRLGEAALKIISECSFTTRKLRFLGLFRLASPSLGDFSTHHKPRIHRVDLNYSKILDGAPGRPAQARVGQGVSGLQSRGDRVESGFVDET